MAERKKTGELLLDGGWINQQQLDDALLEQSRSGSKIGQILIERGYISSETLGTVLQTVTDVLYEHVSADKIDPSVFHLLNEEYVRRNRIIPYRILPDKKLAVVGVPPIDTKVLEEVSLMTGRRLLAHIMTEREFSQLLGSIYGLRSRAKELEQKIGEQGSSKTHVSMPIIPLVSGEEAPGVEMANSIISDAIGAGASDIHIDPEQGYCRIRYRVDGRLKDIINIPSDLADSVVSRIKITAKMDIAEHRRPLDGHFSVSYQNMVFDFRIATIGTSFGEKVTIRILDKKSVNYDLDRLGMFPDQEAVYERIIRKPYGIILVSGPTGSGKTTTLYATLNRLQDKSHSIVTIEDPIEYDMEGAVQIQVNQSAGITFDTGLRSILRLDPNIIMVGEIRDIETARIAMEAAMTGHLVLASIHTNDAANVPIRLIDLGIEPYIVASAIAGVVAQRLVRTICASCKTAYEPTQGELSFIASHGSEPVSKLYHGTGCDTCAHEGYVGRIGVYEILDVNKQLRKLIEQKPSADHLRTVAMEMGMVPMEHTALARVIDGTTTLDEARKVIATGDY